jgi:hypothetical protein
MPSVRRQKKAARPAPKARPPARKPAARPTSGGSAKRPAPPTTRPSAAKAKPRPKGSSTAGPPPPTLEVPLPGGRRHVLSLSFVRDGEDFLARLETDSGHITELKNRSLDQLLTLVAGELEDLLE